MIIRRMTWAAGQRFVKEVYETLRSSPQWEEMALLITYDEHGGFMITCPRRLKMCRILMGLLDRPVYFGFDRLGVRVPTFLISPWIEKGTVIHEPEGPTPHSQYEHSSIPATKYFCIRDSLRQDCPEKLAEVERSLRPWGAKEDAKLSEFQVELIQLASQLVGDHLLNSYPDIGKNMTVREGNKYAEDAVEKFLEAGKAALKAGADENTIVTMRPSLTTRTSPSEGTNKYI
ncbi:Non-specific phospholipase C1 [Raphanus sativus]|nr:Non-specific phospholipase C1 [Raphanus sativus]